MEDVYYSPEKFGLKQIDEIDTGGDYEYDKLVVWQHESGRLFYAMDSGCSCPSPFEGYTSLEALIEITRQKDSLDAFEAAVNNTEVSKVEKIRFISLVKELLALGQTKEAHND